jgi:hypothetical protein
VEAKECDCRYLVLEGILLILEGLLCSLFDELLTHILESGGPLLLSQRCNLVSGLGKVIMTTVVGALV